VVKVNPTALKAAMEKRGATLRGLASNLGVEVGTLRAYVEYRSAMPVPTAERIADCLGVEVETITQ